ncbi:MAG: bifunctional folylpolyglutamate synthase/dihydrofolate synthase [Lachnospiraceae bacterium]|nr:bifunctional folylpolyglutamate synthase/dihydrofolate synthase [Lachnospiraceae bacterium]
MTYKEALEKIDSLLVFGSKLGLDRIEELLQLMGNPQDNIKFVHVAGTNGKGSVSNMTARILTAAGYKTGLFTSPHITGFGERMQIDFNKISQQEVIELTERLFPLVERLRAEDKIITEFEFVTAMAFEWFSEQEVDVVVLETGLGGKFDATNVIKTPLCSVITSISLDHTAVLGDTLAKIAEEKCGIIKDSGATVFAFQEDSVNTVVTETASKRNNVLYTPFNLPVLLSDITGSIVSYDGMEIKLPLVGMHQVNNLALVLAAVQALRSRGLSIDNDAIRNGVECVKIPARFELLSNNPMVIFDGGHNPGGLAALSSAVDKYLSDKKIICVMGMLKDKDCRSALSVLKGKIYKLITTTVAESPRRQTAEELKETASEYFDNIVADENAVNAFKAALKFAEETKDSVVLVCGSLYLAAQLREYYLNEKE